VFEVLDGGLMATVQDLGRTVYLSNAMNKSGAMDCSSLVMGNLLVGNEPGFAGVETSIGLKVRALSAVIVSFTGGDLSPKINGAEAPMWETLKMKKGDILSFGAIRSGYRAYVCIRGGIDVPLLFGSRSTYVSGRSGDLGFGGYKGRPFRKGDLFEIGNPGRSDSGEVKKVKPFLIPEFESSLTVRVVLGPFEHFLTEKGLDILLTYPWEVSYRAGRTGYWYDGPTVEFRERGDRQLRGAGTHPSNCISDGVPTGGLQAPFGVPVVFCPDQSIIGGHVRIATVISPDMDKIGQSKPGDKTFFKPVKVAESWQILREKQEFFKPENLFI
jgi:antagonist of KipI